MNRNYYCAVSMGMSVGFIYWLAASLLVGNVFHAFCALSAAVGWWLLALEVSRRT